MPHSTVGSFIDGLIVNEDSKTEESLRRVEEYKLIKRVQAKLEQKEGDGQKRKLSDN